MCFVVVELILDILSIATAFVHLPQQLNPKATNTTILHFAVTPNSLHSLQRLQSFSTGHHSLPISQISLSTWTGNHPSTSRATVLKALSVLGVELLSPECRFCQVLGFLSSMELSGFSI